LRELLTTEINSEVLNQAMNLNPEEVMDIINNDSSTFENMNFVDIKKILLDEYSEEDNTPNMETVTIPTSLLENIKENISFNTIQTMDIQITKIHDTFDNQVSQTNMPITQENLLAPIENMEITEIKPQESKEEKLNKTESQEMKSNQIDLPFEKFKSPKPGTKNLRSKQKTPPTRQVTKRKRKHIEENKENIGGISKRRLKTPKKLQKGSTPIILRTRAAITLKNIKPFKLEEK